MTRGLPQQEPGLGYSIPQSAVSPQHGQKASSKPLAVREPRQCIPRPGH
jgi:hypothetical protein